MVGAQAARIKEPNTTTHFYDSPHGVSPVLGESLSPASASVKDLRYDVGATDPHRVDETNG